MDRLDIIEEWASLDATFDEAVQEQIRLVAEAVGVAPECVATAISASHEPEREAPRLRAKWWPWKFR